MGTLRDSLIATGIPSQTYWGADNDKQVAATALKGKKTRLPAPWNKRNGSLEKTIQKEIRLALRLAGGEFRRIEGGAKLSHAGNGDFQMLASEQKGISDLIGFLDGVFCAIEVKAPGGSLSTEQVAYLDSVSWQGNKRSSAIACVGVSTAIVGLIKEFTRLEMWVQDPLTAAKLLPGHVIHRPMGTIWLIG